MQQRPPSNQPTIFGPKNAHNKRDGEREISRETHQGASKEAKEAIGEDANANGKCGEDAIEESKRGQEGSWAWRRGGGCGEEDQMKGSMFLSTPMRFKREKAYSIQFEEDGV